MSDLPWAGPWPWSARCRAYRERRPFWSRARGACEPYGRCELRPHTEAVAHALSHQDQSGPESPLRWRTDWEVAR
jgi:hypothetical protein